jgi:lipoprotein NlpI
MRIVRPVDLGKQRQRFWGELAARKTLFLRHLMMAGRVPFWQRAVVLLIAVVAVSSAAVCDDREPCVSAKGEESIVACTKLIEAGELQGRQLAELFVARGLAFGGLGNLDAENRDFTQAIQVDAGYAIAFNNRCAVDNMQGAFDLAIKDCEAAIQLKPDYSKAYLGRGNAYRYKGDFDLAL